MLVTNKVTYISLTRRKASARGVERASRMSLKIEEIGRKNIVRDKGAIEPSPKLPEERRGRDANNVGRLLKEP